MKTKTRKRAKRRKIWPIALLVIAAATVGGYLYYTRYVTPAEEAEEPALQTTTVRKGDIVITAAGSGNLMPVAEVALGFRTGGTLVELAAEVGDEVEAGQTLARLDDVAAQIQVAQAELNLEQAKAKLETLRRTSAQTLEIAQVNLEAAQADYDALVQETEHTGDRLTSVRVNLEQAVEQLADAQEAYDAAWDPARDWELAVKNRATALENERASTTRSLEKAQDDLQIARANYNLMVLSLDDDSATRAAWARVLAAQQTVEETGSGADVQAAEWAVRQAELALESTRLALENVVLLSPAAGTVVDISASVGEAVGSNPIVTLADLDATQVRFYMEESDLDKVAAGNKVTVVFDALPDQEFTGAIARVDPMLVTVDGTFAAQAWAVLDVPDDQTALLAGLTAEVKVVAGEAYKTLLVPVQALRELAPGQFAVFVVNESGELKIRPVEVGLRDFANAQILSGLEQGEVISTGTVETE